MDSQLQPNLRSQGWNLRVIDHCQYGDILSQYIAGSTLNVIAKQFNVWPTTISCILRKQGVQCRTSKYSYNKTFFSVIDTPDKAYFLGLMFTDGNVEHNGRTAKITLQIQDAYILDEFASRIFIGSRPHLYHDDHDYKKFNGRRQAKRVLKMSCGPLVQDLIRLGCVPAKSLSLHFPVALLRNREVLWHFMRGLFDGDGSLSLARGKYLNVTYVGSHYLVKAIWVVLRQYGFRSTVFNCGKFSRLRVFSDSIRPMLTLMYKDSKGLRLERKHNRYVTYA